MINIISENNNLDTRINLIILNILHNFFKNFLNDFQQIKNFLLCITKESKCKCFSCDIYNDNLKNDKENNNIFKCFNCGFKTNLILQIIDPLNDDNLNVCGFCNLNSFFEKDNNIFEGQKEFNLINFKNNNNDDNNNNNEEENVELNISNLEIDINQINNDNNYIQNEDELAMSGENSNEFAKKYLSSKSKSFIKFNNNLTARVAAHNLQNSPSYMLALCPKLLENFDKKI
jgi:hypothetical protein